MIRHRDYKQFSSASKRFLNAAIERFLKDQIPICGGTELRKIIACKLIELFDSIMPENTRIKPGQILWLAIDKSIRADSPNVKYKPVILTLVDPLEVELLANSRRTPAKLLPEMVARLCNEAYKQDALLSMRDIALFVKRSECLITYARQQYEKSNNCLLPTPAVLQDMGSGVTHKGLILRKLLVEKKDMGVVRNETHHTQQAIDRYVKDYRRVEMLLDDKKDIFYISQITQMSNNLIVQYKKLYNEIKQKN
jgi:hypothetical protein